MSQHHFPYTRETAVRDALLDAPRKHLVAEIIRQDAILTELREYIDYLEREHPNHAPASTIGIIKKLKAITKYKGGVY